MSPGFSSPFWAVSSTSKPSFKRFLAGVFRGVDDSRGSDDDDDDDVVGTGRDSLAGEADPSMVWSVALLEAESLLPSPLLELPDDDEESSELLSFQSDANCSGDAIFNTEVKRKIERIHAVK